MEDKIVYFIKVEDVTVSSTIIDMYFECDLEKCKGECCVIEGANGAPITFEESNMLLEIQDKLYKYLSAKHIEILKKYGPFENIKGRLHTRVVDKKECVFVYYEGDIARCAIEKAYDEGEINFRKPISCHLYPIRKIEFGEDVLRFDYYPACEPALNRGLASKTRVYEFCKDAIIRLYGIKWFEKLKKVINNQKR